MEFDKRLMELEVLVSRKASLMEKLDDVNKELNVYKIKRSHLIDEFKKENISITNLDNHSLVDLWLSSLSENKAKLSKNEHDYKLINLLIDAINKEAIDYNNKLAPIYQYEEEYLLLLKQQKDYSNPEVNRKREINKMINQYKVYIKDINDCILTGNQLNQLFSFINENIDKTKKWKVLEIFGKGILANITKNTYIKEVEEKVNTFHYLVNKFSRELNLINKNLNIHLNQKELNEFSNYFFVELYYDMTDTKKFTNIFEFIKRSNKYVNEMLNYLNLIKEDYIQKIINLENSKR